MLSGKKAQKPNLLVSKVHWFADLLDMDRLKQSNLIAKCSHRCYAVIQSALPENAIHGVIPTTAVNVAIFGMVVKYIR